jgi:hypothetical protein
MYSLVKHISSSLWNTNSLPFGVFNIDSFLSVCIYILMVSYFTLILSKKSMDSVPLKLRVLSTKPSGNCTLSKSTAPQIKRFSNWRHTLMSSLDTWFLLFKKVIVNTACDWCQWFNWMLLTIRFLTDYNSLNPPFYVYHQHYTLPRKVIVCPTLLLDKAISHCILNLVCSYWSSYTHITDHNFTQTSWFLHWHLKYGRRN